MSKILIITNHSYMLYQFRLDLIRRLMEEHEVVLSMPFVGHEEDFCALGLRCIRTDVDRRGINPKTDWKLFSAYRRILREENPDLVITYSIKPNVYGGIACSLHHIPYCANVQGLGTAFERPVLAVFVTVLYKIAFRKVRTVFFENKDDAAVFRKKKIVSSEKQVVLSGAGIDLTSYPQKPCPENERIHFLYLGRLMKEKGVDELFAAMERLYKTYGKRVLLDVVGFFEEEYEEPLHQLEAKGIAVFHGFQPKPQPYYAAADCVVLPSWHEGMSNVLLEAAATGRPIITSDIPGCREAVEDGKSGYLCRAKDADSLYEQMCRLVEATPAQRRAMGEAGRRKMEREFDKRQVVDQTIEALFPKETAHV